MNNSDRAKMSSITDHKIRKGLVFALVALSATWAHAQNAIKSLTGGVQGGVEVIRIETNQPLPAVPTGFTIQSPARIALDFPGMANAIGRNSIELNQGNLRSANVEHWLHHQASANAS